jgi:hypothetical protein
MAKKIIPEAADKKLQLSATKNAKKSQIKPRKRNLTRRLKRKVDKKAKRSAPTPAAYRLFWRSLKHLWIHKKLFIGILLIFGVLNLLFVKGIAGNFQLGNFKDSLDSVFGESVSTLSSSVSLFGLLIGSAASTGSEAGSVYQIVLLLVSSLALIWALRHTYEKKIKVRVRDAFYKGMYPIIPLLLVLLVIFLQFLPMLLGSAIYGAVQSSGVAAGTLESILWLVFLLVTVLASVYMLSSSFFALYIVTLPDMTPLRALRAARKMVKYRRLEIIRKLLFLPLAILIVAALVLIPLIIVLPVAAEIFYMIGSVVVLAVVHSYGYALYRELL